MTQTRKVLVVDDNEDIHDLIQFIFAEKINQRQDDPLSNLENLLGNPPPMRKTDALHFKVESAYQGLEGVEKIDAAIKKGDPYSLIFMDVRMPPGIDGIEALSRIWKISSIIPTIICTAYSDHSVDEILRKFANPPHLKIISKPFKIETVMELVLSLVK